MTASVHASIAGLLSAAADCGIRQGADSGEPRIAYNELFAAAGVEVGVWTSTEGGWEIVERPDTEIVSILSGKASITDAGGAVREVGPGDAFVLPKGWSGRWDIIEPIEKFYVIVEEELT